MTSPFDSTSNPQYSSFIHLSRYARWLPDLNRRETWAETVQRYIDFFKNRFPDLAEEIQELYAPIYNLEVMPSMRCMMTAGKALEKSEVSGYNCAFVAMDHPRAFDELLFICMNGTGVGFSVERQYISKLPEVAEEFHDSGTTIVVKDSKIGWAAALRELISLLYSGQIPSWDLSKLRPAGARLKTMGGRSSGALPLDRLFKFAVNLFKKAAGRKLLSVECHDLACMIGEVVVVGGIRRTALLSLSNVSDDRMRLAKSGQWWVDNPQRALANNTAAYTERPDFEVFLNEWKALYESKSGERGILNRKAAQKQASKRGLRDPDVDYGTNPCMPSFATVLTPEGIKTFADIDVGTIIWSGLQWTPVVRKLATGVKPVYKYITEAGSFVGTANHKIVQNGVKIEVSEAVSIDSCARPSGDITLNQSNKIINTVYLGDMPVYDITVEAPEHTFWSDDLHVGNCGEIILKSKAFCNLTEVIIRSTDSLSDLKRKAKAATILGTLQSSLTNFKYIRKAWRENAEAERLLGVSVTGVEDHAVMGDADHPDLSKWLTALKTETIEVNQIWAEKLGIGTSVAIGTCKPSGTVSQLTDTASGIHPRFSPYYIRRVRADKLDPLAKMMQLYEFPCEDDVMNKGAVVFSFPIKAPEGAKTAANVTAMDQLKLWKMYHDHWCDHNPSITVYYRDHEFLEVGNWVWNNFDEISGIAFLPYTDHTYVQAPYEAITKAQYEAMVALMPKSIDWSELSNFEAEDNTIGGQTLACSSSNGACEVVDLIK